MVLDQPLANGGADPLCADHAPPGVADHPPEGANDVCRNDEGGTHGGTVTRSVGRDGLAVVLLWWSDGASVRLDLLHYQRLGTGLTFWEPVYPIQARIHLPAEK